MKHTFIIKKYFYDVLSDVINVHTDMPLFYDKCLSEENLSLTSRPCHD